MSNETKQQGASPYEYGCVGKNITIVKKMNLQSGPPLPITRDWVRLVRALLDYMNWPIEKWSVQDKTTVGRSVGGKHHEVKANISFSYDDVSVNAQLSVTEASENTRIVLFEIEGGGRIVNNVEIDFKPSALSENSLDTTPRGEQSMSFFDVIDKMAYGINERFVNAALYPRDTKAKR